MDRRDRRWDKAVRFWETATGKPVGSPLMIDSLISSVTYSRDDKSLLVGFTDQTARVWDPATGEPISPPFIHKGHVNSVAFRRDGRAALTGSADGTARIWAVDGPVQWTGPFKGLLSGSIARLRC